MNLTAEQVEILRLVAPWALADNCVSYTSGTLRRRLGMTNLRSLYHYLRRNGIDTFVTPSRRLLIPRQAIVEHLLRLNGSPVSQ
jgi:hypothetical protein